MPKSRPSMTDRYIQPELPDQGKSQSLIEAVTTMRSKLNIFWADLGSQGPQWGRYSPGRSLDLQCHGCQGVNSYDVYYSGASLQPRREKGCDATTATTKVKDLHKTGYIHLRFALVSAREVCASDPGPHRIPHQDPAGKGPGGWKHPVKAQPPSSICSGYRYGLGIKPVVVKQWLEKFDV